MSEFKCEVLIVTIESHPDTQATAIELACIGDYRSVVRKGAFKTGDKVVYLPEASLLPPDMLEHLGLVGKLRGAKGNRIGPVKLRGCLSQGIVYPADPSWEVGTDVASLLGVTKWEPEVPPALSGEMQVCQGVKLRFDLENIKKYPHLIAEGEDVWMTEKLHGTCAVFGDIAREFRHPEMIERQYWVSTKNAADGSLCPTGMFFKDNDNNARNTYVKAFYANDMAVKLHALRALLRLDGKEVNFAMDNVWILGEIFGGGIQDLKYGLSKPELRIFAMKYGNHWLPLVDVERYCQQLRLIMVPVLYRGPFSKAVLAEHTNGQETVGSGSHTREGVVVVPSSGRSSPEIAHGRVALKSIAEAYLLRKNGTELT